MGNKNKKRRTGLLSSAEVKTELPSAGQDATGSKGSDGAEALDINILLRAVGWLTSHCKAGLAVAPASSAGQALHEALQPVILARVSKYEEDAKAAGVNPSAPAAAAAAANSRKRQAVIGFGHGEASLPDEDVPLAMKAFGTLAGRLEDLNTKEYKPLRAALHPLVEAHLREENASPAFRITRMLGQQSRWASALPILAELRTAPAAKRPKLGAYMRWVRELNVAAGSPQEIATLDAIMRCAGGLPKGTAPSPGEGSLKQVPPFRCETSASASDSKGSAVESEAPAKFAPGAFSVIAHEAAHDRKPPNHFDLDIYSLAPGVINLSAAPPREAARHPVPGLEGAFVLSNVLSNTECSSIRGLTEAIGYRLDLPLSSVPDERAQNVVILASEADNDALFARVRELLPPTLEGEQLVGFNRRWRIYRYQAGNVYRKHLDGAWPASGTKPCTNGRPEEYMYDAFDGRRGSRFTFIVYLNDNFEGGCTSFFTPDPEHDGVLEARPVQPQTGCASVFVHGDTGVPLLHEGSAVTKGTKYLLRTEVMYECAESNEERREAARLRGLARQIGKEEGDDEEEGFQRGKGKVIKSGKLKQKHAAANKKASESSDESSEVEAIAKKNKSGKFQRNKRAARSL